MRLVCARDFPTLRESMALEIEQLRSGDPLSPLTVIVPSGIARDEMRRDLARRLSGVIAVEIVTLPRWVDAMAAGAIAEAGGRFLTEAGFERAAARVLEERARRRSVGPLLEAASAAGRSRLLAGSLGDLYEGGFDPQSDEVEAVVGRDPARRVLSSLFRDLDDLLRREHWFDRRSTERLAGEIARKGGVNGAAPSPVLVFGFHDLTPVQRDLLEAASRSRPLTLFVPGPSAGPAVGETAVEPLLSWARGSGAECEIRSDEGSPLVDLVSGFFGPPTLTDPGVDRLEIAGYATEADEVRAIAGRILDEVEEAERSFGDFLITVPAGGGPAPALFRRIFAKAGIPLHDAVGVRASRTEGGRRALALARAHAAARDSADRDALDFLAPIDRAASHAPEATEAFVRARDAAEVVTRFRELHEARFGEPPAAEVEEILEAVRLVAGARPLRPRDFPGVLASGLDARRVRASSPRGGALLTTMDAARGVARPVAFHAGLVRGAIRRPAAEDPLLPDAMRRELTDLHAHRGRRLSSLEDRTEERLLLARFAFGAATELAILSFAERDRVGGETRNPSGLLLDVTSSRAGQPLDPRSATFRSIAPPRARERSSLRPADLTDLDLSRLAEGTSLTTNDLAAFLGQPRARHLARVLRAAEARWSDPRSGPWDGVLSDPRAIRAVGTRVEQRHWSASSLEKLLNCPFSFLLGLLNVDPSADETDDFDPMERGNLFHELAERAYRALLESGLLPLTPSALPQALALVDADIRVADAALAGEPVLARMHRRATLRELRNDLALVLSREAHRPADERTTPVRFELTFGGEEDPEPPVFPLPSGRRLPLRGRVDRVDERSDGRLEIVDFKTGQIRGAKNGALRASVEGKAGVRLQLPLYLTAVAQRLGKPGARATYYYATAAQDFHEVTYDADDLERDRNEIGALLELAVSRAKEGWFPCTPGASACCFRRSAGACGPGVAERFRRKLEDDDLARYVALVRGQTTGDVENEE